MSQYESLGTSASKEALHQALRSAGLTESERYFAQLFPDSAGDPAYYSFLHCDGAGTKSLVAYLQYRETGDPSAFKGIAQDALVMNLDDVYCVGPVEGLMLANAIARNSSVIGEDVLTALFQGYRECAERLAANGVPIQLSGGETADVGDVVRTIIVDAVLSGRVRKDRLIDTSRIVPGDVIVGVASYGKAAYEDRPNSGIGSNGLTLARHALLKPDYQSRYLETTAAERNSTTKAVGRFALSDAPDGLGMTIGEALLSPTRSFAPILAKLFDEAGLEIHGIIHNTGGGLTKILRFGRGVRYVKDALLPVPKVFSLIQEGANVSFEEMCRVFNMGCRLEVYLPATSAQKVITAAAAFGIEAKLIGRVEASTQPSQNQLEVTSGSSKAAYSHVL